MRALLVVFSLVAACSGDALQIAATQSAPIIAPATTAQQTQDMSTGVIAASYCPGLAQFVAAPSASCGAARYQLDCIDDHTGNGLGCLSATRDACPPDTTVEGSFTSCTSTCRDDEFAAECGGAYPPGCRPVTGTPDGTAILCCPCGS